MVVVGFQAIVLDFPGKDVEWFRYISAPVMAISGIVFRN
jgi:hypothetical protein